MSQKFKKQQAIFFILMISSFLCYAQNENSDQTQPTLYFDGFYLGANFGFQNIFAGADVDNLDVLAQDSKFVFEFTPGHRWQLLNKRFVIGAELQFGLTNGNLSTIDHRNQKHISYNNNKQIGYGINLGVAMGTNKNHHIYLYGQVTKRDFDVTITNPDGSEYMQKDGQKFGRYGLGYETPVYKSIHIKGSIGLVSVDFGDKITNMDVEDNIDLSIGINYQF